VSLPVGVSDTVISTDKAMSSSKVGIKLYSENNIHYLKQNVIIYLELFYMLANIRNEVCVSFRCAFICDPRGVIVYRDVDEDLMKPHDLQHTHTHTHTHTETAVLRTVS